MLVFPQDFFEIAASLDLVERKKIVKKISSEDVNIFKLLHAVL